METWSGAGHRDRVRLEAFLPPILRRHLARDPVSALRPAAATFQTALLVTDLSGFSSLAENFAQAGPRGAEDLSSVLNFFCGRLVDLIEAHGGEIIQFAGDAAVAHWPVGDDDRSDAACAAGRCALAAQQLFESVGAPNGARLRVRAGLGLGEAWSANVGGVAERWELLVAGDALAQAADALATAGPDEIAVSTAAWACMASRAQGTSEGTRHIRLQAVTPAAVATPAPAIPGAPLDPVLLRAYVPRSVRSRLDARQSEWLAEFRCVTALFVKLDRLDYASPTALDQLQRAFVAVQTAVYRYGGSINQLVVDDKGTIVVCGWGLALHAHSDDQVRAVRAALDLRAGLLAVGSSGSFGLATGDVFTALLGNSEHCAYAMIGDVVNVAARLMQAADGEILCDLASCEAAGTRIAFEALAPLKVKGRDRAVEVFRPVQRASSGPAQMVGRVYERRRLRERLATVASTLGGGAVILEGDPGIGKSRLVADVIEQAVAKGVRTISAAGDAIERSAPYHVWCPLFTNLCGLEGLTSGGGPEERIVDLLKSSPKLAPFAPLLNPILRLNFPETEQSPHVPPRGRALITRELLIHLFRRTAGGRPTLLVIEDAHWLDSASWALAEAIERDLPEVLLLIAMRALSEEELPGELMRLKVRARSLVLRLDTLTPEETTSLACQRLRARGLTPPVAQLIRDKTDGHPFFIEELAHVLRDRSLIQVDEGMCRFTAASAAVASVQLPSTLQVMVSSRIDQLTVGQQLATKVASILGRSFDLEGLHAIYPLEIGRPELADDVEALVERNLVQIVLPPPTRTYAFKHAITQEVAYGLLPYALRRRLHAAAAAWYERQHAADLSSCYPLLAHHWSSAEAGERALFYLDKAGEQALTRHANEEALRFYSQAVEIDETLTPAVPSAAPIVINGRTVSVRDARRIGWERRLGDASTNLCRWNDGRSHFERALRLIGRPLPGSDRRFAIGVGMEIVAQSAHRLGIWRFSRVSGPGGDLLHEAVCAYQRIGSISYQDGRMIAAAYALVAALNLAERLAPTSQLALGCADVSNVLGLVPLRSLARTYQQKAKDVAAGLHDPVISARVAGRAAIYRLGIGDWTACADLETAMARCDEIGDSYVWEENAAIRARAAQLRGEFELAGALGAEVRRRSATNASVPHEIWGIGGEVWANLYLDRPQIAIGLADAGLRLLSASTSSDRLATLDFLGAKALAHLRRDQLAQSHQAAEQIIESLANSPSPGYFSLLGISAAVEVCLTVWEAEGTSPRGGEAETQVRHLCRHLDRYARVSPPARARALLWRGRAEWLRGQCDRAQATWRDCLVESERFALPYEAGYTHFEIGRHLGRTNPERRSHLVSAQEQFRQLRADFDLRRVDAALRES